jgi:hypothetical protein
MNIFKNRFNIIQDQYYININKIINTFNPNDTSIFLFTKNLENKELISIVGDNQIYTDLLYLDKIYYIFNFYKIINKIVIFIDMPTSSLLDNLDELNITYIYCSNNLINHQKLNIILPHKLTIEQSKRYAIMFNINQRVEDYYNYINSINDTILYKKDNEWIQYIYSLNSKYSNYIYKFLNNHSANIINYNIKEKPSLPNIINDNNSLEKILNNIASHNHNKFDINQKPNNTIIKYYDNINNLDNIKELLDII